MTAEPLPTAHPEPESLPRPPRAALRVLQCGALAAAVAVVPFQAFELDRFFVPKELALHLTALLAGLLALRAMLRSGATRVDRLLGWYLLVSGVSVLFATNPWLAFRALAISVSGVLLFRVARALRAHELAAPLLHLLAAAVVLVAIGSLLQTYGVDLAIFSENRAPGGTLGNRNFVAHVCAFGLPLLLLAVMRLRNAMFGVAGVTIVTAALVLTRSRAAWLAFAAVVVVFLACILLVRSLRRDSRTWRRLGLLAIVAAGGVLAALLLPNTLRWRSDHPYLETVKRVTDYQEGSGHGRLVQYERTLRMAVSAPLLGVGPGNWAVEYPTHAARHDPSMSDNDGGMTTNPWPSSDWVAIVAERGIVAAVLFALAFFALAVHGARRLAHAQRVEEGWEAAALLAMLVGIGVTSLFDAVLLLALPTLLIFPALGALFVPMETAPRPTRLTLVVMLLLAGVGAARSVAQLAAMQMFVAHGDRASLAQAARIDPGNYRLRMRLSRMGKRPQRCEHALAARGLFPSSQAARAASRGCAQ